MAQEEPLIIVGCPRSGTYLLCSILQEAFNIAIPVETQFIPLFSSFRLLVGSLNKKKNREILVRSIFDFLTIWTRIASKGRSYDKDKKFSLLIVKPYIEDIIEQSYSMSSIINQIFSKYAFLKNCERWGDKVAFRTPPLMGAYRRLFPKMKVIHIVRDGRDVALSWRKIWTGPSRMSVMARSWVRQVSYFRGWGRNNYNNEYLELRYEDLLNDIECVLQQIGKFMNADPLATGTHLIGREFAQALSNGNTHPMLAGRINKGNQLKWIKKMNDKDLATFESIAKKELIKSGYVCSRHFEDPNSFLISIKMFADFIINMISPINILYKAKYILPAFLIIFNRCKQIIQMTRGM